MATITNNLASALPGLTGSTTAAGTSGSTTGAGGVTVPTTDPLASEEAFLKLLVAQFQNQDPENTADPTQMVTQLAQFSQLEQSLAMRQDLDAIRQSLTALPASQTTGGQQPPAPSNPQTPATPAP